MYGTPAEVDQIGEYARHLIRTDVRGEVLVSVSRAIYLRTTRDQVFWLGTERVPLHRRGMRVTGPIPKCEAGTPFRALGDALLIGERYRFEIDRAREWHSSSIFPKSPSTSRAILERLHGFCSMYRPLNDDGFGVFIQTILRRGSPETNSLELNSAQRAAKHAIESVVEASLNGDLPTVLQHGEALIGLGAGLTPSGDDFLGGLLFTAHHLRAERWVSERWSEDLVPSWIEEAKPRTHPISFVMLSDHAAGFGAEDLHYLLRSLLSMGGVAESLRIARRLDRIGHTTGSDQVTGLLTGMLLMKNTKDPIQHWMPDERVPAPTG